MGQPYSDVSIRCALGCPMLLLANCIPFGADVHPLEVYMRDIAAIHATGASVDETSYYAPLSNLLSEAGRALHPRVRTVMTIRNQGAGLPDGGFFTPDQLRDSPSDPLSKGALPARGVLEVKPLTAQIETVAHSTQVKDQYWPRYQQVLVTNLREFLLVSTDANGNFSIREKFTIASSEQDFRSLAKDPKSSAAQHGPPLLDYLARVLTHAAPLREPRDVAWLLASYARDGLRRLQTAKLRDLTDIRRGLEQALGLRFTGREGEHFFQSSLVQTIFYGVFSAWVLWAKTNPPGQGAKFDWRLAGWTLRVPMVSALFAQLNTPSRLTALNLVELLTWTGDALNRVDRASFFSKFEENQAIQYFYEPFLQAFDPVLRKQLGIWYTPPEVVRYMVKRVDQVLREQLDVEGGLANPDVVVLDPCTGTGSYLIETLKVIAETLAERGEDALAGNDLKAAATQRLFGFELLPAPYIVAHLQVGLALLAAGAPLEEGERAAVYLTNSLTGWSQGVKPEAVALFPELEAEREAAANVKQHERIVVVIGNPPYNAFAGVGTADELGTTSTYKQGLLERWGVRKYNLDDLYVRFFRLAEHRIAEMTTRGIVCYISNYSYLDDSSFVVMRERLIKEFDFLWFDSLNGDSRETGKRTPDGEPDPSVFSTPRNPHGIRVGTAVALLAKTGGTDNAEASVQFRQFWGSNKREELALAVSTGLPPYNEVHSTPDDWYSFKPTDVSANYSDWPLMTDLALVRPYQGLAEDRRKALIHIDRVVLETRMARYLDQTVAYEQLAAEGAPLTTDYVDFPARTVRADVLAHEPYHHRRIRPYATRPMDVQFCYYSSVFPLWRRNRPEFERQAWAGNSFIVTRFNAGAAAEGSVMAVCSSLCDYHFVAPNAAAFPMLVREDASESPAQQPSMELLAGPPRANLSSRTRAYLTDIGIDTSEEVATAATIWNHALSIGSAPAYLSDNRDSVARNWPRIPLPGSKRLLTQSAALGRTLAALLDAEQPVPGITEGAVLPHLRPFGLVAHSGGKQVELKDLSLTAEWGSLNKAGAVMPRRGRTVERPLRSDDIQAISVELGISNEAARTYLGHGALDVYLNDLVYWDNVPRAAWEFRITGVQVLKKWLSYRDASVLGRPITSAEARHFSTSVRRITSIVLIQPALDANYAATVEDAYPWVE